MQPLVLTQIYNVFGCCISYCTFFCYVSVGRYLVFSSHCCKLLRHLSKILYMEEYFLGCTVDKPLSFDKNLQYLWFLLLLHFFVSVWEVLSISSLYCKHYLESFFFGIFGVNFFELLKNIVLAHFSKI